MSNAAITCIVTKQSVAVPACNPGHSGWVKNEDGSAVLFVEGTARTARGAEAMARALAGEAWLLAEDADVEHVLKYGPETEGSHTIRPVLSAWLGKVSHAGTPEALHALMEEMETLEQQLGGYLTKDEYELARRMVDGRRAAMETFPLHEVDEEEGAEAGAPEDAPLGAPTKSGLEDAPPNGVPEPSPPIPLVLDPPAPSKFVVDTCIVCGGNSPPRDVSMPELPCSEECVAKLAAQKAAGQS